MRPRGLHYPWRIEIGDYSAIGDDAWLYSIAPIRIGEHTIVSQKSFLCTRGMIMTIRALRPRSSP